MLGACRKLPNKAGCNQLTRLAYLRGVSDTWSVQCGHQRNVRKSLLAIFKGLHFEVGDALPNKDLEKEFLAAGGTGADDTSAKLFACEQHWIKADGGVTRLTEAGLAAASIRNEIAAP
jgi:hypothetical protein